MELSSNIKLSEFNYISITYINNSNSNNNNNILKTPSDIKLLKISYPFDLNYIPLINSILNVTPIYTKGKIYQGINSEYYIGYTSELNKGEYPLPDVNISA